MEGHEKKKRLEGVRISAERGCIIKSQARRWAWGDLKLDK